jgi:hypothetical protein
MTLPASHSATLRGRPCVTIEKQTPTSVAERPRIGRDGSEYPCHGPRIVTPTGLGRLIPMATRTPINSAARMLPTNTKRCRHRRNTTRATIAPQRSARIVQGEPRLPAPSMTRSRAEVLRAVIDTRKRVSRRSRTSPRRWNNARPSIDTMNKPTISIQKRPLRPRSCGSGGGSPDGRRLTTPERR